MIYIYILYHTLCFISISFTLSADNSSAPFLLCIIHNEVNICTRKVKKYIIAGNGIELSKEKKEFKEGNDEFKFVYIGRYDMYTKGLDLLLAAIKTIKNDAIKNNMKFILYGTDYRGGEEQVKELITNYELEDIVKINGPVWEKEKEKALCDADVFLHVSRTEGQPIGLMEAIDCGVPCIATFETNYGEIIEKNGLGWMAETTVEGIAKKIIEAYNDKDKFKTISQREIEYSKENFEWNKIAKDTIEKYSNLIKK